MPGVLCSHCAASRTAAVTASGNVAADVGVRNRLPLLPAPWTRRHGTGPARDADEPPPQCSSAEGAVFLGIACAVDPQPALSMRRTNAASGRRRPGSVCNKPRVCNSSQVTFRRKVGRRRAWDGSAHNRARRVRRSGALHGSLGRATVGATAPLPEGIRVGTLHSRASRQACGRNRTADGSLDRHCEGTCGGGDHHDPPQTPGNSQTPGNCRRLQLPGLQRCRVNEMSGGESHGTDRRPTPAAPPGVCRRQGRSRLQRQNAPPGACPDIAMSVAGPQRRSTVRLDASPGGCLWRRGHSVGRGHGMSLSHYSEAESRVLSLAASRMSTRRMEARGTLVVAVGATTIPGRALQLATAVSWPLASRMTRL